MTKTWAIADLHFGHRNILTFNQSDGTKLRDFPDIQTHDDTLVNNWNSLVSPKDRIYVLGDVAFNNRNIETVARCNGRKVLVRGNHDELKLSKYSQFFDDIRGIVVKRGFVLTHVPVHPDCLARWGVNIHGHLHANVIRTTNGLPDPRYKCVSVEQTDFKPVQLQELMDGTI